MVSIFLLYFSVRRATGLLVFLYYFSATLANDKNNHKQLMQVNAVLKLV